MKGMRRCKRILFLFIFNVMIMANKTKEDYDNDVMVVRIEALKLSVFVRLISGEHESDMRLELL